MADLEVISLQLAGQISQTERHDAADRNLVGDDRLLACSSEVLDQVVEPCAAVMLRGGVLDLPASETAPGMDSIEWSIIVYVARTDAVDGQRALKAYLRTSGPTSIREAILADRKLNGVLGGGTVRVNGWDPPGEIVVGAVAYLGVELQVSTTCTPDRIQRRQ